MTFQAAARTAFERPLQGDESHPGRRGCQDLCGLRGRNLVDFRA